MKETIPNNIVYQIKIGKEKDIPEEEDIWMAISVELKMSALSSNGGREVTKEALSSNGSLLKLNLLKIFHTLKFIKLLTKADFIPFKMTETWATPLEQRPHDWILTKIRFGSKKYLTQREQRYMLKYFIFLTLGHSDLIRGLWHWACHCGSLHKNRKSKNFILYF